MRPWICLSSSSGETFEKLWAALSEEARKSFLGFFTDRECGARERAPRLVGRERVFNSSKTQIESQVTAFVAGKSEVLVLLCGYFGILSSSFLENLALPIVNTHPSLLPAFPGLDKKVHRQAVESVAVTGFTIHLVTEVLDGGPILFQQPVWVDPDLSDEEMRDRVRDAEQFYLPRIWEDLLASSLSYLDNKATSRELRSRLGLRASHFQDSRKGLTT